MHVLVLGSGVVGTTSAYYLAREGFEVTVVDRQPSVAQETSYANAGQISPGYASPWAAPGVPFKAVKWMLQKHAPLSIRLTADWQQYLFIAQMLRNCTAARYRINKERMVRLSEFSRDCLDELRAETGIQYEGRQGGTTQLFRTQAQLDNAAKDIAVLDELGVAYELLEPGRLSLAEPALARVAHKLSGGLRLPNDQSGDCLMFTSRLAGLAAGLGVQFSFNRTIERIEYSGDRVDGVWIDGQLLTADVYVVALGSFSPQLLAPLGIRAPIYPLKGYSLTVPISNSAQAPVSTLLDETYKVAITRFDQRIRVGGMAEIQGYDTTIDPRRGETLKMVVNNLFPGAGETAQAQLWTGLRPATPDGTPIVGATRYKNLFLNTGHGTLGWTMSCGSARLLADLLAKRPAHIRTDGLDISRYSPRRHKYANPAAKHSDLHG